MSTVFKSRRLRKQAFIKLALLAVPLAFLTVQVVTLGEISKSVLFAVILTSVFGLLTLTHLVLSRQQKRRRQSRSGSVIILPGPVSGEDSAAVPSSGADAGKEKTSTARASVSAPAEGSGRYSVKSPASAVHDGSEPAIRLKRDVSDVHIAEVSATREASGESPTSSDDRTSGVATSGSGIKLESADGAADSSNDYANVVTGHVLGVDHSGAYSDADADADADSSEFDMDATVASPEVMREQVERVGDLVQTHDLGSDHSVDDTDDVAIQGYRNRQDDLSEASTSLITGIGHTDTASLSELSHSEVTQLVVKLNKDKVRLHRLVIAQQSAIESERKAHDRSRSVARDAIKVMRNSRNAQKLAEKAARNEYAERKRIEQEYKKVSRALANARSIIKARKDETT